MIAIDFARPWMSTHRESRLHQSVEKEFPRAGTMSARCPSHARRIKIQGAKYHRARALAVSESLRRRPGRDTRALPSRHPKIKVARPPFAGKFPLREMFRRTPTAASTTTSAEPPYEINGNGTPVNGIEFVTTPILTKA